MKRLLSAFNELITDIFGIAISRDSQRSLLRIPLYSNAMFLVVANAANAMCGFLFWIIAARFYTAEDVGLASAAISAASLLTMLANLGLGYGLIRFLPRSAKQANNMINSCFTIGGLTSIVVAIVFIIGLDLWSPALLPIRHDYLFLFTFVIFTMFYTMSGLAEHAFIARRQASYILTKNIIFNVSKLVLLALLAIFFQAFGIFASWGISLGVSVVVCLLLFLPRSQPGYRFFLTIKTQLVKEMVRFSFANYLSAFFLSASGLVFPIMIVNLLGAESNAYFYIAWSINVVITMIPSAVSASLFAEGSHDETKLKANIVRSLKMVMVILVATVAVVMLLGDKLLLLFGVAYSESGTSLLRILILGTFPNAIIAIYLGIKRVQMDLKIIVGLPAFVAVFSLGLAYFLISRIGINGAGIAWTGTQWIVALAIMTSILKSYRHGDRF